MRKALKSSFLIDLGLIYNTLIWGSTFFIIKSALTDLHPMAMVSYRFIIAGLVMLPFVLHKKNFFLSLKESLLLGILQIICHATQTFGLLYTTASNSGFITGLFLLFVLLFEWFFDKKKPPLIQGIAVILALAGLWQLTGGISGVNRGDALTLVTAITYALHLLITNKYIRRNADLSLLAFHQFWIGGALGLAFCTLSDAPMQIASLKALWVILFLAIFATITTFVIQMIAQKTASPLRVSLIFSLEPLFAAMFSWTLGGEPFFWRRALGGGLILAAMILGDLSQRMPNRKKEILPI